MEKPNAETTAWFRRLVPDDPRADVGQMFGHPCAFTKGHMFFGTFGQSLVVRVGEARAAELAVGPVSVFEPMPGRAWKEYVQVPGGVVADETLAVWAREALDHVFALPPKVKKPAAPKAPKAAGPRGA